MYSQSVPALLSKNVGNSLTNYKTWGGVIVNVKEYGAKGDGVTDDTAAIQAAVNYAFDNGRSPVWLPKGTFLISNKLQLTKGLGVTDPVSLIGASTEAVTLKAAANYPINTPMVEVFGGSGDVREASVRNIMFDGNNVSGIIGVNNRGADGFREIDCYFKNMFIGVQRANTDGGNFTEYAVAVNCNFAASVATVIRYYRTSSAASAESFHGSGLENCQINQGSGYPIVVQDDSGSANAIVYNAPLDFSFWGTNLTVISTNVNNPLRTFGTIRLEGTGITMATGAGRVSHTGIVQTISQDYTAGTFDLTGFKEVGGVRYSYINNIQLAGNPMTINDSDPDVQVRGNQTSGSHFNKFSFYNAVGTLLFQIIQNYYGGASGVNLNASAGHGISFGTNGNTGQLAIDTSGNTIMNAADPELKVKGTLTSGSHFNKISFYNSIDSLMFQIIQNYYGGAAGVKFNAGAGQPISFGTNNIPDRVTIDTDGNISIGGAWNTPHLILGTNHLWTDSTGDLRIKNGAPTSDTDGTVVGTQT